VRTCAGWACIAIRMKPMTHNEGKVSQSVKPGVAQQDGAG
jgi:hypothetical protein